MAGLPPINAAWFKEFDELYDRVLAIHFQLFNPNTQVQDAYDMAEAAHYLGTFMRMVREMSDRRIVLYDEVPT